MNIVVGITTRPESQAALEQAIEESVRCNARLVVVRIMGNMLGESPARVQSWNTAVEEADREGAGLVERLQQRGVRAEYRVEPVQAAPADAILDVADEVGADLIVIGIRRRSPVGKLVLGSVSQAVLLRAKCPVLAVKSPDDE